MFREHDKTQMVFFSLLQFVSTWTVILEPFPALNSGKFFQLTKVLNEPIHSAETRSNMVCQLEAWRCFITFLPTFAETSIRCGFKANDRSSLPAQSICDDTQTKINNLSCAYRRVGLRLTQPTLISINRPHST